MPINSEDFDAQVYCKTAHFRDDLSDLCQSCQLREIITEGIENQIIWQARQQKSILTNSQFEAYCKSEIEKAQRAIEENHLFVRQNREGQKRTGQRIIVNFPGVTLYHVWNKERIKALNRILLLESTNTDSTNQPLDKPNLITPATSAASDQEESTHKKSLSNRQQALKLAIERRTVTREEYGHDIYNRHMELKEISDRTGFANENWAKTKYLLRDYVKVLPTLYDDLVAQAKEEMNIIARGQGKDINDEQFIKYLESL